MISATQISRAFGLRLAAPLCLAAFVAGCGDKPVVDNAPSITVPAPLAKPDLTIRQAALRRERAEAARAANAAADAAARTPASTNMRDYLQNVEAALIAKGKLRTDDGASIPITPEQLTENFIRVALYDEYSRQGRDLVANNRPAPLRRWEMPVRLQVTYGASVSPAERLRLNGQVRNFAAKLQGAMGHPVSLTSGDGNFHLLFLSEDERRAIAPTLQSMVPGIPTSDVRSLANLAPQNYCTVFAYSRGAGASYVTAVAVIRAELPPRLMLSCIHEELAQGMGPANDSPTARPSIFNDDEEFAYLTRHDELILRILYDRRLRPGMTEAEARPIVLQIANELLAGGTGA